MINLITPINSLGYGVAGFNILKSLYEKDPTVALYPIAPPEPEYELPIVQAAIANRNNAILDRPCVKIWHQHDLYNRIGKGLYVGFPIFELTEFSEEEIASLHHCDKIFVCSEWAKGVIVNNTKFDDNDVHVVPLGVDLDIFQPRASSGRPTTVFFNCGKWEKRKGHDVLLDCFNSAFSINDDVELWMMCDNPFIGEQNHGWQKLYKTSPLGAKIRMIPRQQSHKDVYNIMAQTDCGVFPSRGEGWNLELLEMMACGKHVIATNYSAHTQFCSDDNCRLVGIDNLETAYDGVFFSGKIGLWAEVSDIQKEQIVSYMREVHETKQQNGLPVNYSGISTAEKFSWANSVQEVIDGIQNTTTASKSIQTGI